MVSRRLSEKNDPKAKIKAGKKPSKSNTAKPAPATAAIDAIKTKTAAKKLVSAKAALKRPAVVQGAPLHEAVAEAASKSVEVPLTSTGAASASMNPETGFQDAQQAWASVMQPWAAIPAWTINPEALNSLQREYLERAQSLMASPGSGDTAGDKRFSHDAWRHGPFAMAAAAYLLNAEFMT
ncbi:MAG: hypothetical protein EBV49_12735, partial [Betaproteobacteria bacterium]|nr:hypothetical protein [Betaproteobacteria bacterium]